MHVIATYTVNITVRSSVEDLDTPSAARVSMMVQEGVRSDARELARGYGLSRETIGAPEVEVTAKATRTDR
jgi:hypothetical protein